MLPANLKQLPSKPSTLIDIDEFVPKQPLPARPYLIVLDGEGRPAKRFAVIRGAIRKVGMVATAWSFSPREKRLTNHVRRNLPAALWNYFVLEFPAARRSARRIVFRRA
jgi:non-homologous end joining protein Ku